MNCYSPEIRSIRNEMAEDTWDFINFGQALMKEFTEFCKEEGLSNEDILDVAVTYFNGLRTSILWYVGEEFSTEQTGARHWDSQESHRL